MKSKLFLVFVLLLFIGSLLAGVRIRDDVLAAAMEKIAQSEGVPVQYVSSEEMKRMQSEYGLNYKVAGLYVYEGSEERIFIDENYRNRYFVLAHELGHHFAVQFEHDKSQERADEIARELIRHHQYKSAG